MTIISRLDRRQKKAIRDRHRISRATLYNVAKKPESNLELYQAIVAQIEENKRLIERGQQLQQVA